MARINHSDHVLFDECVKSFREDTYDKGIASGVRQTYSYISTSFNIPDDWNFDGFSILKSREEQLFGLHTAYVSCIQNPNYMSEFDSYLFGQTIAAMLTFSTQRPCKSPRDNSLSSHIDLLDQSIIKRIGLSNPTLICSQGAVFTSLPSKKMEKYKSDFTDLVSLLSRLSKNDYLKVMNSIRLVHMSLLNKRDDFGLAYSLLVAAIEAISKIAFKKKDYKERHEKYDHWEKITSHDDELKELFDEYKKQCGYNKYCKKTFKMFIENYAPFESWDSLVESQLSDIDCELVQRNLSQFSPIGMKPSRLSSEQLSLSLDFAYNYRSILVHSGEQPPHIDPSPTASDLYFIDVSKFGEISYAPTYDLLLGLATSSIKNWLKEKV